MAAINREYHKWWSPRLKRDMELLVFGHAGAKVLVFPTRGGRFYEYENLRMVEVLKPKIEQGWLQFYCVDSIDTESFYCWWAHPTGRIERHRQYEEYILNEVYPLMQEKNDHPCTISHGCSLGAYHASAIAFRHPHLFQKLAAFSGRYDLTLRVEAFRDLLDGHYDTDVYYLMPSHFLPNLNDQVQLEHLRQMDIVLTIGAHDPFLSNNKALSRILKRKGIDHHLHVWHGRAHSGYAWRRMAQLYI